MRAPKRPGPSLNRRTGALALAAVVASGGLAAGALAAGLAGDLDPSYGDGGFLDVGALAAGNPVALELDASGRVLTSDYGRVVRLSKDGRPDQTFGVNGAASYPSGFQNPAGLAVDGQGRVLVAGSLQKSGLGNRTALLRLLPDGSPDPSFGPDGVKAVDLVPDTTKAEGATAVLVDEAGRYVVAGTVDDGTAQRTSVLRMFDTGNADTTFSGDGQLVLTSTVATEPTSLASDGSSVVVGGYERAATDTSPVAGLVTRLNANGTLDATFGSAGVARTASASGLQATDVVVLPDRRVRLVGSVVLETSVGGARGRLFGLTATGQPDPAVGTGGERTYDLSPGRGTQLNTAVRVGSSLWVAGAQDLRIEGTALAASSYVGRLSLDGAPDAGFSGDGFAARDEGATPTLPTSIRVDGSGRPVVAGLHFAEQTATTTKLTTRTARYLGADAPPATTTTTAAPPATTATMPAPTPTAPVMPTTPPVVSPPSTTKAPTAASVIRLPSTRLCVAKRRVRLTLKVPTGSKVRKVTVKIGSAKTRTVKAPVTLALKGRARAKVKVVVTVRLSTGKTLKRSATYRLCAAKRG